MTLYKTKLLLALAVSGVSLLSACQHATKPVEPVANAAAVVRTADVVNNAVIRKSPNDDRIYAALLLPNQLQVVLVSDPSLESSAASLAVGVGSAQDPDVQPGLAHYLEHMLFLGTEKYPVPDSFFEFVQANAGSSNAFTAYDKTNFHFDISAAKFGEALDIFSDYFKAPTLDPVFADKERNAVNSEWSMNHNQDNWILHTLDGKTGNPANPLSRFSIGNLETLSDKVEANSKLQDELKAFYARYYSANNMRLTLVGKQSIPELKELAEKYFSGIKNKNIQQPKVTVPGITKAEMGKSIHYHPLKEMKRLYVDFPIKDNKDEWRVKPNEFVNNFITSEEAGTLCEQLRKAGLANTVTAVVNPDEYGVDGYLRIDADLTDKGLNDPDQVIAAVFAYVDLVKKKGLNELYFRELKIMKEKDFANAPKADPANQAIELSMNQFELPIENLLDSEYVYDYFDKKAVSDLLAQLNPANARIWYISQKETAEKTIPYFEGKYSVRDITPQERAKWASIGKTLSFNLPPLNTLFTDKPADIVKNEYLKPHEVVSQAGVEAFLTQPEFYREDKGILSLEVGVDFAQKTAKNIVISNVLNDIYKSQNTTLIDRAERASLHIAVQLSGTNSQIINVSGYTTKHAELVHDLVKNYADLAISEKDFSDALTKYKQNKANAKKAPPFRQAFNQLKRLANNIAWNDDELLAAASTVTIGDVVEYHKATKANPLLRIYAFGNYTDATIKQIALDAEKLLPGKVLPAQRTVQSFITPAIGKDVAIQEKVEQTDNALVDTYFRDKKSDDEQAQLIVLNAIFQNLLFTQLRTNEQLGYVVGSSPLPVNDYPGFAVYVQSSSADLVHIKTRVDKFRKDFLAKLKAVDPQMINQFKKAEAANVLQKPTDFYAEANRFTADFWNAHYEFNSRERYLAALEKVNKENLVALYQSMLLDKKSMNLLIQLKGTTFADKPFAPVKP